MKTDRGRYSLWTTLVVVAVLSTGVLAVGMRTPPMRVAQAGMPAAAPLPVETGTPPAGDAKAEIKWVKSLAEGLKQAADQKKPMMVDFYTDWCGWCKRLDSETYADAKVIAKAKDFVAVKVNAEQDSANAGKYSVEGFPTIVFLDSTGKEIGRVVGFAPPVDFLKQMDAALGKVKPKTT